ncbi:DNA repair protein RecO [Lactiplantibacillus modestisalitolerans]|uniref:DNA repair protein RecO n=1 Tax=Lactiplantibacillus modestisalitolerans TaxID=1457219 RepID=A0ABV5WTT6_9LACO|nr:DNA repair protein RecO [Lactiplantibacillus modestisalitolerans]
MITNFNGILLYRKDYRERDMLIKFLTAEYGKKMFFVRGARRRGFKMAAELLPFTMGEYVGDLRDGLSFINSVKSVQYFEQISQDIALNAYATYVMNLIDVAYPDNQPVGRWYQQLVSALQLIDRNVAPALVANVVEIQLLAAFGVAPELRWCTVCGREDLPLDYSESYGGLLCQQHWHLDPYRLHASQAAIFYLRRFSVLDLAKVRSIKVKPATAAQLRQILDEIYNHSVGIRLKSKRFIDQMGSWYQPLPPRDKN